MMIQTCFFYYFEYVFEYATLMQQKNYIP